MAFLALWQLIDRLTGRSMDDEELARLLVVRLPTFPLVFGLPSLSCVSVCIHAAERG